MTAPALHAVGLMKRFSSFLATDNVDLELRYGEIHALIGPNGAGKTTLIKQISGELRQDAGEIYLDGTEISRMPVSERALAGIGRSFQISSVIAAFTVLQNVMLAAMAANPHRFNIWRSFALERDAMIAARSALAIVGLDSKENMPAQALAHGELRQLELAVVITPRPKILILDEPLAGMSMSESERVVELLDTLRHRYAIMLVEHDVDAVFALADRVTVLAYGRVLATGLPSEVRSNTTVQTAYLGTDE